jgi:hypothetical protein
LPLGDLAQADPLSLAVGCNDKDVPVPGRIARNACHRRSPDTMVLSISTPR